MKENIDEIKSHQCTGVPLISSSSRNLTESNDGAYSQKKIPFH